MPGVEFPDLAKLGIGKPSILEKSTKVVGRYGVSVVRGPNGRQFDRPGGANLADGLEVCSIRIGIRKKEGEPTGIKGTGGRMTQGGTGGSINN